MIAGGDMGHVINTSPGTAGFAPALPVGLRFQQGGCPVSPSARRRSCKRRAPGSGASIFHPQAAS